MERKLYEVTAVVVLIPHILIEVLHGGKPLEPTTVDGGGGRSGHGAPAVLHLPSSHLLHNHSGDMTTVTPYLVSCISTSGWMVNYGTFFLHHVSCTPNV